ncbi:hypothetical protein JCM19237_5701 [Photobacterium aphoticum]|uniref:Uncharacterized protein n=1 Tax=Photobacterium aphoticum TaxID=754436 RepID=A0A090QKM2_9GAMM|nr:hypothetical protein JCM19237_5701 [Photobacterium aphoticum]
MNNAVIFCSTLSGIFADKQRGKPAFQTKKWHKKRAVDNHTARLEDSSA